MSANDDIADIQTRCQKGRMQEKSNRLRNLNRAGLGLATLATALLIVWAKDKHIDDVPAWLHWAGPTLLIGWIIWISIATQRWLSRTSHWKAKSGAVFLVGLLVFLLAEPLVTRWHYFGLAICALIAIQVVQKLALDNIPFLQTKPDISRELEDDLPREGIDRVIFYQRDEVASDLICCDITLGDAVLTFHAGLGGWPRLCDYLATLPGFDAEWWQKVTRTPFARNEIVAFQR